MEAETAYGTAMAQPQSIRSENARQVVTLLRDHGPLSRAELARRTGLTRSTLTQLAEALTMSGLLCEAGHPADPDRREVGRPGTNLALRPDAATFAGVEIGVGVIRLRLLDWAMQDTGEAEIPYDPTATPDEVLGLATRHLKGLYAPPVAGICLTVPGLVRRDGHVITLPILGWKNVPLGDLAAQAFGQRVTVDNNANAAAFGETYGRPADGRGPAIYLKIGNGVGGAILPGDGPPFRGSHGLAAELGHVKVPGTALPCSCGRSGCLEPTINRQALVALLRKQDHSFIDRGSGDLDATAAQVGGVAEAYADRIAVGLASICHVLNPSRIVLGGAARPVFALCLDHIEAALRHHLMIGFDQPEITLSRFGVDDCARGAAMICHAHHVSTL